MNFGDEKLRLELLHKCQTDLWFLGMHVLGWKDFPSPFVKDFHGDVLCEFIQRPPSVRIDPATKQEKAKKWKMLLVFRGGGKSSWFTVARKIQQLLIHGQTSYSSAIFHGKRATAIQLLSDVKAQLEHNALLKWIGQDVFYADPAKESPCWREDAITVKRRLPYRVPSVVAAGVDATLVGLHFNEIHLDDVVTDTTVTTAEQRAKTVAFIRNLFGLWKRTEWNAGTIVGTHWHISDAYQMFEMSDGDYYDDCDTLVLDVWRPGKEGVQTWWPQVLTPEGVSLLEKQMTAGPFWAQIRNRPRPDGSQAFSPDDIHRFDVEFEQREWLRPYPDRAYKIGIVVDPNSSPKTTSDPAAVGVYARDSKGDLWCIDFFRGHPAVTQLKEVIVSLARKWSPDKTFVEASGQQGMFVQELRLYAAAQGVSLGDLVPVSRDSRTSKDERILDVRGFVADRRLHVGRGSKFDPLINEAAAWTPGADRDDCLDTLADAVKRLTPPPPPTREIELPQDPYLLESVLGSGRRYGGDGVVCMEDVVRRAPSKGVR